MLLGWLLIAGGLFVAIALGVGAGGTSAIEAQELAVISAIYVILPLLLAASASSLLRWGRPDLWVLTSVTVALVVMAVAGAYIWW